MFRTIYILLIILFSNPVAADNIKITFNSGTGFYVTPHYVVTNEHVLKHCKQVMVRGAVQPTSATVVGVDKALDLALLRTDQAAPRTAYLRSNPGLKMGDNVNVIGYPGEHADTGKYLLKKAKVIDPDVDYKGVRSIQFTDSVDAGNSGGPLLDYAGNVIGVVVAKVSYYHVRPGQQADKQPYEVRGIAIGLQVLKPFLRRYDVFLTETSSYDIFPNPHPDDRAKEYTVNVLCVQNVEDAAKAFPD